MMHLKPNKNGLADISEFSGYISTKQNIGIISVTRLVLVISVLLALLMVISK